MQSNPTLLQSVQHHLYPRVLGVALTGTEAVSVGRRPVRIPAVLTRDEVTAVLRRLPGVSRLVGLLLYGGGLRLLEETHPAG